MPIFRIYQYRRRGTILGVTAVLFALLSLQACRGSEEEAPKEPALLRVSIREIAPGLTHTFETTGEVQAEKSANFIAEEQSRVVEIHVAIGQAVTEGQKLITLDSPEVAQNLRTANAFYTTTNQTLTQTRLTGNQQVEEADVALKTAEINLGKLLKENAAKRVQAEETRNAATLNFSLSEATAETTLQNAIRKTRTTVHDALREADSMLEFSPEQNGLTFTKDTHIGVRDPVQKRAAHDELNRVYTSFQSYHPTYEGSLDILEHLERALRMLLTTLSHSVTSPLYTVETLNEDSASINTHIANVRTVVSELQSAKRELNSTTQETGTATSQVLIDAEAAFETTMAEIEAEEARARLEVESAKTALETAKASARSNEISAFSNVTTAAGDLEQARITMEELHIVAPFNGVVSALPDQIGREIQPGEQILSIENADTLKIVTFVSSEEVKRISVGDTVAINNEASTRIASIAPSADPNTKKFKVEMYLRTDIVTPGEFVDLTYETVQNGREETVIYVPVTAVHVSAAETFVWVLSKREGDEGVVDKQPVTIGDLSGQYIEITEGLSVGDVLVTDGSRNLQESNTRVGIAPSS